MTFQPYYIISVSLSIEANKGSQLGISKYITYIYSAVMPLDCYYFQPKVMTLIDNGNGNSVNSNGCYKKVTVK